MRCLLDLLPHRRRLADLRRRAAEQQPVVDAAKAVLRAHGFKVA